MKQHKSKGVKIGRGPSGLKLKGDMPVKGGHKAVGKKKL
jgi:hypothetical protein